MDATREALAAILKAWDDDAEWTAARDLMERARSVLSQEPGGALTTKTRPEGCSCECYPETEDQEDIDLECPCCHAAKGEFCRHPA